MFLSERIVGDGDMATLGQITQRVPFAVLLFLLFFLGFCREESVSAESSFEVLLRLGSCGPGEPFELRFLEM